MRPGIVRISKERRFQPVTVPFMRSAGADNSRLSRVLDFFESAFQVMMKVADWVLSMIPYGVFALMVKVVEDIAGVIAARG